MSPDRLVTGADHLTGAFVAIVGPSGSGKDSVIAAARAALGDDGFVFVRRAITRAAGSAEDSTAVTEEEFAAAERDGAFALSWRAHGLAYGIPADAVAQAREGAVVIGNVSRAVLSELDGRFDRAFAVRITVPEEVRRARIAARGREDDAALAARLNRADPAPDHPVDLEIVNDGTLEEAGETLASFLRAVASGEARPVAARSPEKPRSPVAARSPEKPRSTEKTAGSDPENAASPAEAAARR